MTVSRAPLHAEEVLHPTAPIAAEAPQSGPFAKPSGACMQINGKANATLMEAAAKAGVPRFVYISAHIPNVPGLGESRKARCLPQTTAKMRAHLSVTWLCVAKNGYCVFHCQWLLLCTLHLHVQGMQADCRPLRLQQVQSSSSSTVQGSGTIQGSSKSSK